MRTSTQIRGARSGASWIILIGTVTLVLAACGGSAAAPILSTVGGPIEGEAFPSAAASAGPAAPADDGGAPGGGDLGSGPVGAVTDVKIVRTGTMELQVQDVPRAVGAGRDTILGLGGYIGASTTFNDGDEPVAEITYRIPVDRWEEALGALRSLNGLTKKVVTEQTSAVEVTGQVVDLEARIRNLRASETALQAIAAKATKVSDVLEVQAQLTDVRGQIEQLTAQLTDLGNRAALATLTVTYRVQLVAVEVAQQDWDPTTVVDEASASMVDLLQSLVSAGIWFGIVWLPILVVLAVLTLIVLWVLRRLGVRRGSPPMLPPAVPPAPPTAPLTGEG